MKTNHFECDTVCGFMTEGYDKEEIAKIAFDHVKAHHANVNPTEDMVRGMITEVDAKPAE